MHTLFIHFVFNEDYIDDTERFKAVQIKDLLHLPPHAYYPATHTNKLYTIFPYMEENLLCTIQNVLKSAAKLIFSMFTGKTVFGLCFYLWVLIMSPIHEMWLN